MAIAYVQSANQALGSTSAKAFASNVTAGNFICVFVGGYAGSEGSLVVTDNLGNTYTRVTKITHTGDNLDLYCYYAYNIAGGACTVTMSGDSYGLQALIIMEFSGVRTAADPLDVYGGVNSDASDPVSVSLTTTTDGLIVFLYADVNAHRYNAPASGYTLAEQEAGTCWDAVYKVSATAGSNSPGVDLTSGNATTMTLAAAFKIPAAAGGVFDLSATLRHVAGIGA